MPIFMLNMITIIILKIIKSRDLELLKIAQFTKNLSVLAALSADKCQSCRVIFVREEQDE